MLNRNEFNLILKYNMYSYIYGFIIGIWIGSLLGFLFLNTVTKYPWKMH